MPVLGTSGNLREASGAQRRHMLMFGRILRLVVPLIVAIVVSVTGIKRFEAWDQVTTLWDSGTAPILLIDNPHLFRFLVVYPGFLLEELLPDVGFSIYIGIFFALNCIIWRQTVVLSVGRAPPLWAWVIFVSAHAAMNGRGVLAWTAWLLCVAIALRVLQQTKSVISESPKVLLSCFLATVSTGVFVVVFSAFAFTIVRLSRMKKTERRRGASFMGRIAIIVVMGIFAKYFWAAIDKNLEFFGGGFNGAVNMFSHGAGVVFSGDIVGMTLLIWAMMVAILLGLRLAFGRQLPVAVLFTILPLAGGLFGFTVLTLSIPMVLILLANAARRQSPQGN